MFVGFLLSLKRMGEGMGEGGRGCEGIEGRERRWVLDPLDGGVNALN